MKIDLKEYLKNLRIQKKKRRQFISLMTAMSFVVSGGVFWQLRSIGTAMIDGNVHDLDETEPLVLSDDDQAITFTRAK